MNNVKKGFFISWPIFYENNIFYVIENENQLKNYIKSTIEKNISKNLVENNFDLQLLIKLLITRLEISDFVANIFILQKLNKFKSEAQNDVKFLFEASSIVIDRGYITNINFNLTDTQLKILNYDNKYIPFEESINLIKNINLIKKYYKNELELYDMLNDILVNLKRKDLIINKTYQNFDTTFRLSIKESINSLIIKELLKFDKEKIKHIYETNIKNNHYVNNNKIYNQKLKNGTIVKQDINYEEEFRQILIFEKTKIPFKYIEEIENSYKNVLKENYSTAYSKIEKIYINTELNNLKNLNNSEKPIKAKIVKI